jgi:hypothetical protein
MIVPNVIRGMWAALRVLWWKLRGRPVIVPGQEQEYRVSICEDDCEWFDPQDRQCLDCTCFVDLKTWTASESCPRGKWDIYLAKRVAREHSKGKL